MATTSKTRISWLRAAISVQPGSTFPEISSFLRLERAGRIEYTANACFLTAETLLDQMLALDARRLLFAYYARRWTPMAPHGPWTDWSSRCTNPQQGRATGRPTPQEHAFLVYEREHSVHQGSPLELHLRFQSESPNLSRFSIHTDAPAWMCVRDHPESPARGSVYVDGAPSLHVRVLDSDVQLHRAVQYFTSEAARHVQWILTEQWRTNPYPTIPSPNPQGVTPKLLTITFRSWQALTKCLTVLGSVGGPWPRDTTFDLHFIGNRVDWYGANHLDIICLGLTVAKRLGSESLSREVLRLTWHLYVCRNVELEHISNGELRTWKEGVLRYLREPYAIGTSANAVPFVYHPTGISSMLINPTLLWPAVEPATLPLWAYLCSTSIRRQTASVSWGPVRRVQGAVLRGIVQHVSADALQFLQAATGSGCRANHIDWSLLWELTEESDVLPRGAVPLERKRGSEEEAEEVEEEEEEEVEGKGKGKGKAIARSESGRRRTLTSSAPAPRRMRARTALRHTTSTSPIVAAWLQDHFDILVRIAPTATHLWMLIGQQPCPSLAHHLIAACARAVDPRPILSALQEDHSDVYVTTQLQYLGAATIAANLLRRAWNAKWVASTTFPQTVLEIATLLPLPETTLCHIDSLQLPVELEGVARYGWSTLQHAPVHRRHLWTTVSLLSMTRRMLVGVRCHVSDPLLTSPWMSDRFYRGCMSHMLQLYPGQGCELECLDEVQPIYSLEGVSTDAVCSHRAPAEKLSQVPIQPYPLTRLQLEQLATRYVGEMAREADTGGEGMDAWHHAYTRQWRWLAQCLAVHLRNPGVYMCRATNGMRQLSVELLLALPQEWSPVRFLLFMLWMRVWGVSRRYAPMLVSVTFHQSPSEWIAVYRHFIETWLYTVLIEQREALEPEDGAPWMEASQMQAPDTSVHATMLRHSVSVELHPTVEVMQCLHRLLRASSPLTYNEWLYCTAWMTVLSVRSRDAALKLLPLYLAATEPLLATLESTMKRCVVAIVDHVILSSDQLQVLLYGTARCHMAWGQLAYSHPTSNLHHFTVHLGPKVPIDVALRQLSAGGCRIQLWRLALRSYDRPMDVWWNRFASTASVSSTPGGPTTLVARALIAAQLADRISTPPCRREISIA